ncbi:dual specificity protein phosphatase family protein [Oscillatoria sp. FACHB-1407]|uniref:protein-tyrosine phosphatase family protein n=1 Tax=Oscillatoria sp. FACHB-1407 TaxID=2692847 RepID=UPI001686FA39|nr:dual specificity protein phosphatase [Oscillatoria sp. FACHB-1407]MBD2459857.1 dual specificity protein phosphatase family protein [Oscillatoria sp. FACHB-1407]
MQVQRTVRSLYKLIGHITSDSATSSTQVSGRSVVHWVLPNCLAIGALPKEGASVTLAQAGIKAILSLCAPSEGQLPNDVAQSFRCLRFILPDSQFIAGLQVQQLAVAVDLIHSSIQADEPMYVHCLAGIERSPTVCIAYLCRYHNLELWEAVNCLKQAHARSMPTNAQIQVIREFLQSPINPSEDGFATWN